MRSELRHLAPAAQNKWRIHPNSEQSPCVARRFATSCRCKEHQPKTREIVADESDLTIAWPIQLAKASG